MYDWKEYVGYQPNTLIVFYLILDSDKESKKILAIANAKNRNFCDF